jgi:hypothetical protein
MRPVWLIEAGVYGAEAEPLLAEIRRQGMVAEVVPYQALKKGAEVIVDGRPLGPTDCVIGYGTYPFARQIQLHHRWVPGAWCQPENLDCAAYYAYFQSPSARVRASRRPGLHRTARNRPEPCFPGFSLPSTPEQSIPLSRTGPHWDAQDRAQHGYREEQAYGHGSYQSRLRPGRTAPSPGRAGSGRAAPRRLP